MRKGLCRLLCLFLVLLPLVPASAATNVVIFVGSPGEEVFASRFFGWAMRLEQALTQGFGLEDDEIHRYPALPTDPPLTREQVEKALETLGDRLTSEDQLMVVLIGHGSESGSPRFILEGPDLDGASLAVWLDALPATEQLVLQTASGSGAFVGPLGGPNRVVCASTEPGAGKNAPEFMEYLVAALEEGRGDADRNGRLSWGEWLNVAAADTAAWYESEGYIQSEHAILDDTGDGQGVRLPVTLAEADKDGARASQQYIAELPQVDAARQAAYETALASVAAWRAQKESMEPTAYWTELERLLLDVARNYPSTAVLP